MKYSFADMASDTANVVLVCFTETQSLNIDQETAEGETLSRSRPMRRDEEMRGRWGGHKEEQNTHVPVR